MRWLLVGQFFVFIFTSGLFANTPQGDLNKMSDKQLQSLSPQVLHEIIQTRFTSPPNLILYPDQIETLYNSKAFWQRRYHIVSLGAVAGVSLGGSIGSAAYLRYMNDPRGAALIQASTLALLVPVLGAFTFLPGRLIARDVKKETGIVLSKEMQKEILLLRSLVRACHHSRKSEP